MLSSLQYYYYYVQKAVRNVCKYLEKRYEEKNAKHKFHMPKKTVAPMSNDDDQPDVDMSIGHHQCCLKPVIDWNFTVDSRTRMRRQYLL